MDFGVGMKGVGGGRMQGGCRFGGSIGATSVSRRYPVSLWVYGVLALCGGREGVVVG